MTPAAPSSGRLLGLYSPREPALRYLFEAVAARHAFTALWPADTTDMLRWAGGRKRYGPVRFKPLPFWPWQKTPLLMRRTLRRLAATHRAVVLTRPDQAVLLPWFAAARKIYYAMDDYQGYGRDWIAEEKALLAAADAVVAVSERLGEVLCSRGDGVASRLVVSPNAVPASWIPDILPAPSGADGARRPRIGIIGRISSRLRLDWLAEAAARLPGFEWLFVGDVEEGELLDADRPHLAKLQSLPQCSFVGPKPYEELRAYARTVDIALLPYSDRSINPSASPMRFFIHLAFGQPILVTPGCDMLERWGPLVTMCRSPDELVGAIERLNAAGMDDGLRERRWSEAKRHTWDARAERLLPAFSGGG